MLDLRDTARDFIAGAFEVLRKEFIIPTPVHYPYMKVGRDYFGETIHQVPAFEALTQQLETLYPQRFAQPLMSQDLEFASTYIFSFLEAAITACGSPGYHKEEEDLFDPMREAVTRCIEELIAVLDASTYEVVCCRFATHLSTADDNEVTLGGITVVPEPPGYDGLSQRIVDEIAGGWSAFNRDDPRPFAKPHALLIIRDLTDSPNPFEVSSQLSDKLERFLLIARLFTAGTAYTAYEITGTTTLVSRMGSHMNEFKPSSSLVRRTVWLTEDHGPAFSEIGRLLDEADIRREGMAATSFDVALRKFNASHHQENQYESLVDLATGLEAILAGGETETEGVSLRLRSRAAALLATDHDPAKSIFEDIKLLYGLRSKLVHGGQIKRKDLKRDLEKISTMPDDVNRDHLGTAMGYGIDRLRDLLRRAILARLCLANGPEPLWPFNDSTSVDSKLSDDQTRSDWRNHWHQKLAVHGIEAAANPPTAAVDALMPHDQERPTS